uniref:Uncharacterized protein n=1 Tax=Rattus norvegicus TaxID=10116 RepID=A0ABK0LYQ1_RAT
MPEEDWKSTMRRMLFQFQLCYGHLDDIPPFLDLLTSLSVHLEQWVFQALFGSRIELLFERLETYHVYIRMEIVVDGIILHIYGLEAFRAFTMFVIVALACSLRIKRNRARALARGLQNPLWWSRRRYI